MQLDTNSNAAAATSLPIGTICRHAFSGAIVKTVTEPRRVQVGDAYEWCVDVATSFILYRLDKDVNVEYLEKSDEAFEGLKPAPLPEAKVGDLIQSYNVTMPIDTSRSSFLGVVTKVEVNPDDGVEYVFYTPICCLPGIARDGRGTADAVVSYAQDRGIASQICAPQTNTPTWLGEITDGIVIVTRNYAATA